MAQTTFSGPVKSLNGFIGAGKGNVVEHSTTTLTVSVEAHAGRIVALDNTTVTVTLPTISAATDSPAAGPNDYNSGNNIGATFTFVTKTAASPVVINTDGTDKFVGAITVASTNATTAANNVFVPAAANDIITMNGTTQGGAVGSVVKLTALYDNKWFVEGLTLQSTNSANVTPFSGS